MMDSPNPVAVVLTATALALAPTGAVAKDDQEYQTPALMEKLYACESISGESDRLACFEEAVAAIRQAEDRRDLTFADREQVKKAKRGLFGLGTIRLGIFSRGDNGGDEDELQEIEANVLSITKQSDGKLLLRLEDGSVWAQTRLEKVRIRELNSKTVKIKRGSFGNYKAQLDAGSYITVRRVN